MNNRLSFVNLSGKDQRYKFDLIGVRFGEKSFLFWKNKGNTTINKVAVIFDKKYEGMQIQDGVMVLSLKGLMNYNDLREALAIFINNVVSNKNNIEFQFVIDEERQRQVADALGKEFGLSYVINNVNQNQLNNIKAMEDKLKRSANVNGNEMIEKYDNGQLKKITIHNGNAYENNGLLDSEEEKASLLRKWMNDPVIVREISNLNEQELNDLLSKEVLSNRKQYRLEETNQQLANDRAGEVAMDIAEQNGGLVNTELNIVQHTDFRDNQYSTVEKKGDNVQVVDPNVTKSQINTGGVSNNSSGNNYYHSEIDLQEREITDRVFFVDEDNNIINEDYEIIGKLGVDGYRMDYENNALIRYDQMVGYIGDYKDKGKSTSMEKSNVRRKVLEKDTINDRSSGFVSIAIIMFVLSALLLMGSIILLFVLD